MGRNPQKLSHTTVGLHPTFSQGLSVVVQEPPVFGKVLRCFPYAPPHLPPPPPQRTALPVSPGAMGEGRGCGERGDGSCEAWAGGCSEASNSAKSAPLLSQCSEASEIPSISFYRLRHFTPKSCRAFSLSNLKHISDRGSHFMARFSCRRSGMARLVQTCD